MCTFRVTAARDASMERIHGHAIGPVVTLGTLLTVHARCVVLTVDADPSPCIGAFGVQARLLLFHIRVIVTVRGMPVAVAGFTLTVLPPSSRLPALLIVARTAAITSLPTGVVLAFTPELFLRVVSGTLIRMAVANTPPADADVLYAVIVPPGNSGVSLCFGDKMPKEGIGSEKSQANVCCFSKLPQGVRESEIFCTWTTIYQGYNHLAIFQRHNAGILRDTEHLVIPGDGHACFLPKLF